MIFFLLSNFFCRSFRERTRKLDMKRSLIILTDRNCMHKFERMKSRWLIALTVQVALVTFGLFVVLYHQSSNSNAVNSQFNNYPHITTIKQQQNELFISNKQIEKPIVKKKIAYIFAGGVRSFVCPKVHWSIRLNLIDALGSEPYTFIRLSAEDNTNTHSGKGVLWKPSYKPNEVEETLKILAPKTVQYFTFADQEEEMKRFVYMYIIV